MKFIWEKKYTWRFLLGLAAIAVIAGLFVPGGEGESGLWWSHIFSFYALLGFFGTLLLVALAQFGFRLLSRKEDYYD